MTVSKIEKIFYRIDNRLIYLKEEEFNRPDYKNIERIGELTDIRNYIEQVQKKIVVSEMKLGKIYKIEAYDHHSMNFNREDGFDQGLIGAIDNAIENETEKLMSVGEFILEKGPYVYLRSVWHEARVSVLDKFSTRSFSDGAENLEIHGIFKAAIISAQVLGNIKEDNCVTCLQPIKKCECD